jgi:hypothetical protein
VILGSHDRSVDLAGDLLAGDLEILDGDLPFLPEPPAEAGQVADHEIDLQIDHQITTSQHLRSIASSSLDQIVR